jgi:hypothetical protein
MDIEALAPRMKETCDIACDWVLQKLNHRECLSVLALLLTESDKEATLYHQETVETAMDLAHEELESRREGLVGYVLAYDGGWMDADKGKQRAIFLETEAKGMDRPLCCARRLTTDASRTLVLTGEVFYWGPPEWSLFCEPVWTEATRLREENARLRNLIRQLTPVNRKLEHITLTVDWHPKFTLLMTHIRHWIEANEGLQKQIDSLQARRPGGKQTSPRLDSPPEEIARKDIQPPEPEKTAESQKLRFWKFSHGMGCLDQPPLRAALTPAEQKELRWGQARLLMKLRELRETQEDTAVHERLWERLQKVVSLDELRQIREKLSEVEKNPPRPTLDKLRRDRKKLDSEAQWLECQVNLRKKRQAEEAAAAASDDPKWAAEKAELEAKIEGLKQQNDQLKDRIRELRKAEVPDLPESVEEHQTQQPQYNPYTAAIAGIASSLLNWLEGPRLAEIALRLGEPSLRIDLFAGEVQPVVFVDPRMKQCIQAHQEWLRGYMRGCRCPVEQVQSVRVTLTFGKIFRECGVKYVHYYSRTELTLKDGRVFVNEEESVSPRYFTAKERKAYRAEMEEVRRKDEQRKAAEAEVKKERQAWGAQPRNLKAFIETCRWKNPIPARGDLNVEQEAQRKIIADAMHHYFSSCAPHLLCVAPLPVERAKKLSTHVLMSTSVPGLVAAEELLVPPCDQLIYLSNDEYEKRWVGELKGWHAELWGFVECHLVIHTNPADNLLRGAEKYLIPAGAVPWVFLEHRLFHWKWANDTYLHLWAWDSKTATLVKKNFGGWSC